jgi:tRNA dimethylallyltransferase
MKKPLIVLTGPTAAGKTHLSIALAKAVNGEIISADSMQVYKYMDIGSAKIRQEEMQGVKHYLVDELLPEEEFHIVKFQQMAKAAMKEIYAKGKIPILVGGTGFYIQAITKDIDFTQAEQEDGYRQELEQLAAEKGNEYLHQMLLEVDPVSAKEIHANNVKRVIRALEFYHQNHSPISAHNQEQKEHETPYNLAYFVLNVPRDLLYKRIDDRIDEMLEEGVHVDNDKDYPKLEAHQSTYLPLEQTSDGFPLLRPYTPSLQVWKQRFQGDLYLSQMQDYPAFPETILPHPAHRDWSVRH